MSKPTQLPLFKMSPSIKELKEMSLYKLRLTPEEQKRYDEMMRDSGKPKKPASFGNGAYEIEVLKNIERFGRLWDGPYKSRPAWLQPAAKRAMRRGLVDHNHIKNNPVWWLLPEGKRLLEELRTSEERN